MTPRETEVAQLLACRATNAEIAESLGMSGHTARNHTRRVLEKLGLSSKAQMRTHSRSSPRRKIARN
ncbi:MAG: helix-turn-helix transcriptional regulator [Actinobacteria bacterium]|nr:helix-turn-helix transcriptional regulator [Actinomycetota bacterium]